MKVSDEDYDLMLMEFEDRFLDTQNPVFMMSAFVMARNCGRNPPDYLIDYVANVFEYYLKMAGTTSLDIIFEVKKGKGQRPAYKDAVAYQTEYFKMMDIYTLKNVFHYPTNDAATMVYRKYATIEEHELDLNCSGADTLEQKYKRKHWNAKFEKDLFCQWQASILVGKAKEDYLKSFSK